MGEEINKQEVILPLTPPKIYTSPRATVTKFNPVLRPQNSEMLVK